MPGRWLPGGRVLLARARPLVALLSILVFAGTGYGWATLRYLNGGLITSDVLSNDAGGQAPADGATDILLVGLDSRTDARGNPLPPQVLAQLHSGDDSGELNTDTLIMVHIPNDPAKKAVAVSLPRDSYVSVPDFGQHKINSAYQRATLDAQQRLRQVGLSGAALDQQSRLAGRRELVRTVQQLTGVTIDHYAEISLGGFYEISQAVGGVPVCLNAPVHDSFSGANFPAGPQLVQGAAALAFVRQRHELPRGDLDRIVRQQVFLASLAHSLLAGGTLTNPGRLNGLVATVEKYVVLDRGWDLLGFARQASSLTGGNIEFRTIPTGRLDLATPFDGEAVQVDPQQVRAFIAGFTQGGLPAPGPDPGSTPNPGNAAVTVEVGNAAGVPGLTQRVVAVLAENGFTARVVGLAGAGNPAVPVMSVVRYGKGRLTAAQQVAAALGGLPVGLDSALTRAQVRVILGTNYIGPGSPSAPSTAAGTSPSANPAPPPPITADSIPCIN